MIDETNTEPNAPAEPLEPTAGQPTPTPDDMVERAVRNIGDLAAEDAPAPQAETLPDEEVPVAETEAIPDEPGDESYDEPADEDDNPFARAGDAARGAQQSIRDGIEAFRSVREASQRHSSARDELREMQEILDAHTAELEHRMDIEQRYPQIVSEQTAELQEATTAEQTAGQRIAQLDAEREDLESQLSIMKDRHEDQLRPYRNVAESTKGRADDTARALAEARRSVKSAEGGLAEATKRRDQRISAANRAVDTAQDRQRKLEADLVTEQGKEEPSANAVARLQNELVSVKAHLDAARADVPAVTEAARADVESAQQRVFDLRNVLAQAERDAEAAKKEAADRRAEYDGLLKKAQDEEKALSEQIKLHVTASEQARKDRSNAQARIEAARALLDEAESIHTTPRDTIALRDQVAREQTDLAVQQDEVDALASDERELRRSTFKQRLLLIVGAVVALALVIGIVAAVVMGRRAATKRPEPTQVETTRIDVEDDDDAEADEKADTDAKATGEADKN